MADAAGVTEAEVAAVYTVTRDNATQPVHPSPPWWVPHACPPLPPRGATRLCSPAAAPLSRLPAPRRGQLCTCTQHAEVVTCPTWEETCVFSTPWNYPRLLGRRVGTLINICRAVDVIKLHTEGAFYTSRRFRLAVR